MKRIIITTIVAFVLGLCTGWLIWDGVVTRMMGPTCLDGARPDEYGCCTDEVYTDMGDLGFNCCPPGDGDCFPPMK